MAQPSGCHEPVRSPETLPPPALTPCQPVQVARPAPAGYPAEGRPAPTGYPAEARPALDRPCSRRIGLAAGLLITCLPVRTKAQIAGCTIDPSWAFGCIYLPRGVSSIPFPGVLSYRIFPKQVHLCYIPPGRSVTSFPLRRSWVILYSPGAFSYIISLGPFIGYIIFPWGVQL